MGTLDDLVGATLREAPEVVTPGDLGDELASFVRAVRATNVSPNTVSAYGGAVRQTQLPRLATAGRSRVHQARAQDRP